MEALLQWVASVAIVLGTLFSVVAVVGYIRLPDVYCRLHATGKVGVFGVALLLVAGVALGAQHVSKAILLMAFLVVAGPVTSHALASAAYRMGIRPKKLCATTCRVRRGVLPEGARFVGEDETRRR